jgi:hypothetical protein
MHAMALCSQVLDCATAAPLCMVSSASYAAQQVLRQVLVLTLCIYTLLMLLYVCNTQECEAASTAC